MLVNSKTNQFGQREVRLPVPRIPGTVVCPRTLLLHHMSMTKGRPEDDPLFTYRNEKGKYVPLTYSIFLKTLKELLVKCGVDPAKYAGHSFRRGGATFAYEHTLNPLLVKALGDWVSDTFMRYCEIQMDMRRQAAQAMAAATQKVLPPVTASQPPLTLPPQQKQLQQQRQTAAPSGAGKWVLSTTTQQKPTAPGPAAAPKAANKGA